MQGNRRGTKFTIMPEGITRIKHTQKRALLRFVKPLFLRPKCTHITGVEYISISYFAFEGTEVGVS